MFQDRWVTHACEYCKHVHEFPLNLFAFKENVYENHVIATCEKCNRDFVFELYNSYINKNYRTLPKTSLD